MAAASGGAGRGDGHAPRGAVVIALGVCESGQADGLPARHQEWRFAYGALVAQAVAILQELQGLAGANNAHEGPVFQTTAMALRKGFKRALERAQQQYKEDCRAASKRPVRGFLEDVHFHDTRHEAASRLSEKLSNVLELSAVTGHKDLRMLKRYYHPRAEDLAKKLG